MSGIIQVVQLYFKKQLTTDGNNVTATDMDIDVPDIERLGPYLAGMRVMTCTEGRTNNHSYKLCFYWSLDGRQWNGPVDLCSYISSPGGDAIATEFTDATKFGLHLRFVVRQINTAGTNVERCVSSAWLVLRFQS